MALLSLELNLEQGTPSGATKLHVRRGPGALTRLGTTCKAVLTVCSWSVFMVCEAVPTHCTSLILRHPTNRTRYRGPFAINIGININNSMSINTNVEQNINIMIYIRKNTCISIVDEFRIRASISKNMRMTISCSITVIMTISFPRSICIVFNLISLVVLLLETCSDLH